MADNIDTRIIQMRFDNAQFEKNIAKSQKSIEELKEAMDFEETSKGLEKFSRGMDMLSFSNLTENIQRLTDKFTGLGDIGEYVISRIRRTIESTAQSIEAFIKSISVDQITVGESKYDALNKAVNTIIAGGKYTEEEAYSVMERVMKYTDQTSHSFQTMVGQISALQSVGMGLDTAEKFLEGIANAATHAGAGASEAAASMSILSKIMGGSTTLNRMQFDSLNQTYHVISEEWRKLAIEAGLEAGTLVKQGDKVFTNVKGVKKMEVTVKELENTLSQGKWFNSDVAKLLYGKYQFGETLEDLAHPEDAMDSFGKTAYLTGQRALTLADALNAIKETVSSGWMQTFRIVLGDVTEAAEFFTNICDRVVESIEGIIDLRNEILKSWRFNGGHSSMMDILLGDYWREEGQETGAVGFLDILDRVKKMIRDGIVNFLTLFTDDPVMKRLMKSDPEYLVAWIGNRLAAVTKSIEDFMKRIQDFFNAEIDVNGKTKTRLEVIQDIVNGVAATLFLGLQLLNAVSSFILQIAADLDPSFQAILGFLGDLGISIFNTAENTEGGNKITKFFRDLAETLKPVTEGINHVIQPLVRILRLIFGLDNEDPNFDGTLGLFGQVLQTLADIVAKVAGPILTFIGDILTAIDKLARGEIDWKTFGQDLSRGFSDMLLSFVDNLPDSFGFLGDWIKDLFGLWEDDSDEHYKSFFGFLRKLFTEGFSSFNELLSGLTEGLSLTQFIKTKMGFGAAFDFLNTVAGWFKGTNLYGVIMAFLGVATLGSLFRLIFQAGKAVKTIGGFFDDVGGNLKAGVLGHYEWFSEKMLNFAKSILMIAGAIMLLGAMKPDALIRGGIAVGLIFAALWLITKQFDKMKGTYMQQLAATAMFDALAAAIVAITLALSVLMLAMIPLASDWNRMLAACLGFVVILGSIGAFMVIMIKQMDILSRTMSGAGGYQTWGGIGKLALMMGMLSAFVVVVAASMSVLMVAIAPLAAMSWQSIAAAVLGFVAILGSIGAFMIIMLKQMNSFMKTGLWGNGWKQIGMMAAMIAMISVAVAAISVSLAALLIAMAPLSAMSWQSILASTAAIALILTSIGAFIVIMLRQMNGFMETGLKGNSWKQIAQMAVMMIALSAAVAILAAGISVLVVAMAPLAAMSWQSIAAASLAVGVVLLEIGIFIKLMLNVFDNFVSAVGGGGTSWGGIGKAVVMMLSLAAMIAVLSGSIALMIAAITPLALIGWEGISKMILGLGAVLTELALFMKITSKMPTGATAKMISFAGFAVSVGLLIMAVMPLTLVGWEGWAKALGGLGLVLLELIGFMWLTSKLPAGATAKMIGFAGFALSIGILIYAIQPLAAMSIGGWAQALGGLAIVLLELIAAMKIMQMAKVDTGSLVGFIGFAASIAILLLAIQPLADMSPQGYQQALIGLAAVLLEIVVLMGIMDMVQPNLKSSLSTVLLLAGVGAAMILFGIAFNEIKDVPWETVVAFSAGIAAIVLALGVAGVAANAFSLKGILLLVVGLAAIIGVIALMAPLLIGSVASALTDMASHFTLISNLMSTISTNSANVDEGGIDKMIRILGKMKDLFLGMIGFTFAKDGINAFTEACAEMNLAAGQLQLFNGKMAEIPEDGGFDKLNGIVTKMKELLDGPLSDFGSYNGKANSFSTVMFQLGTALGTFEFNTQGVGDPAESNALKTIAALADSSSGLDTLAKLNLDNLTAGMTGLGGAMMLYAQGAEQVGSLEGFDAEGEGKTNVEAAVQLMQAISTSLAEAGGFTIPGNMPDESQLTLFGASLAGLAGALIQFEQAGAGLGEGTDKALETLTFFKDLKNQLQTTGFAENWAAIQEEGGDALTTDKTSELTQFGTNISQLAQSMGQFAKATSYVDQETNEVKTFDYSKATDAMTAIAQIAVDLPSLSSSTDLLIEKKQTLTDFAAQIELLGTALNDFHNQTTTTNDGIQTEFDYTNAVTALQNIAAIPGSMPVKPGWIPRLWKGEPPDLTDLAVDIVALGGSLNQFATDLAGDEEHAAFDPTIVEPAVASLGPIIEILTTLKEKLPTIGGLGNIISTVFTGRDINLQDLGTQMGYLGDGLGKLGDGMNGHGWDNTDAAVNAWAALDSIMDIMIKLQQMNEMGTNAYLNLNTLTLFLEGLTTGLELYDEDAKQMVQHSSVAEKLVEFMDDLNYAFWAMESVDPEDDNIQNVVDRFELFRVFAEGLNNLTNSNLQIDWKYIGTKLTTDVAGSIISGIDSVTEALGSLLAAIETTGLTHEGYNWLAIGSAVSDGIILGISGGTEGVTIAAQNIAKAAYEAAMRTLNANSPSKVFMDVGSYIGLGMAIGMTNTEGNVVDAATGMSESAIETAGTMMATISRIMAEGADANPTITPVLDLSQVEAGLAGMNGSFGGRTIGISAAYSSANAGQIGSGGQSDNGNQNGINLDGIYERMNAMSERIVEMGKSISNMKIVLNSGVIAGGVTDDVDMNLGRKIFYAGRNN